MINDKYKRIASAFQENIFYLRIKNNPFDYFFIEQAIRRTRKSVREDIKQKMLESDSDQ